MPLSSCLLHPLPRLLFILFDTVTIQVFLRKVPLGRSETLLGCFFKPLERLGFVCLHSVAGSVALRQRDLSVGTAPGRLLLQFLNTYIVEIFPCGGFCIVGGGASGEQEQHHRCGEELYFHGVTFV